MQKPNIAAYEPKKVILKKGQDYFWCRCGLSKNQPFCDGSHQGTDFEPTKFKASQNGEVFLCQCKQTHNQPFCDGTHKSLDQTPLNMAQSSSEPKSTREEPTLELIRHIASDEFNLHDDLKAMGVPRINLPQWDDLQILVAQLANRPLEENVEVKTELVLGPNVKKPLYMKIPIFVSDMSFGSLSFEAKLALAKGAEGAGTGICSGEGGMLPEEQQHNQRYLFELGSGKFGYTPEVIKKVQAFHFKAGQAAKTGIGGHLPGSKVTKKIAKVRGIKEGSCAISPPTFQDLFTPADYKRVADEVRDITGGIPIGFKLSANHIEEDIAFALEASADYLILDGRGGATGAAPALFRDNISVPTIPALARARRFLDSQNRNDVTLIITGGLRTPADFIKALCLGADGIAIANAAIQSVGCIAARICHTNQCPSGVATQDPSLRKRVDIEKGAKRLTNFLHNAALQIQVIARACGYNHINQFNCNDLTTWKKELSELSGVKYSGIT